MHSSAGATESDTEEDAGGIWESNVMTTAIAEKVDFAFATVEADPLRLLRSDAMIPSFDSGGIETEADISRFGDITFKDGIFESPFGGEERVFLMFFHSVVHNFGDFFHSFIRVFHRSIEVGGVRSGVFVLFCEAAQVDNSEGELMNGFCDAGDKSLSGGADGSESALKTEREEKTDDGDSEEAPAELMAFQGVVDKENDNSDGVGVDSAAGKSKEESHREKAGEDDHADVLPFFPGELGEFDTVMKEVMLDFVFKIVGLGGHIATKPAGAEGDKIEGGESRGEEEIAHELRFDGEARGVREAKRMIGAAGTE